MNDTYFRRTARRVASATKPLYVGASWRWVDNFSPRPTEEIPRSHLNFTLVRQGWILLRWFWQLSQRYCLENALHFTDISQEIWKLRIKSIYAIKKVWLSLSRCLLNSPLRDFLQGTHVLNLMEIRQTVIAFINLWFATQIWDTKLFWVGHDTVICMLISQHSCISYSN